MSNAAGASAAGVAMGTSPVVGERRRETGGGREGRPSRGDAGRAPAGDGHNARPYPQYASRADPVPSPDGPAGHSPIAREAPAPSRPRASGWGRGGAPGRRIAARVARHGRCPMDSPIFLLGLALLLVALLLPDN